LQISEAIDTNSLRLTNGAFAGSNILTQATHLGNAGDVVVKTKRLSLREGGFVGSRTLSQGQGGDVSIDADERIEIIAVEGSTDPSGISSSSIGLGDGGQITIETGQLRIWGSGAVTSSAFGNGNAGSVSADIILAGDGGRITASTQSGEGGALDLRANNLIVLRNNSLISAEAGGSGDGGNIVLQSPIILGVENSDIIANAFEGDGGNIDVAALSILGLAFRESLKSFSGLRLLGRLVSESVALPARQRLLRG